MASRRPPKLTFRAEPESGDVLERPRACPGSALIGQRYLVLLIHGFNNTQKQAQEAYDGFLSLQRELGDLNPDQPVADGRIVEFYWPGDVGWWGWSRAKNYEDSLERAIGIAQQLPEALRRAVGHNDRIEIDIVAHSMGCRLTIELIRRLIAVPDVSIQRVVFMAAAVPTFLLEPPERLRTGLDHPRVEGVMSLFSADDWVLDNAFPLGQWDAQGESWTDGDEWRRGNTVALGHERWVPVNPPRVLSQENQIQISGAGHSDYWGWREKTRDRQGRWANILVKDFLRFTDAGSREVLSRERADRETAPGRTGGPDREPASRNPDGSEGDRCVEV